MRSCLALSAVLALATGIAAVPQPSGAMTTRSGSVTRFIGVDEIVEACTTAGSFVNMPTMVKTFTVGGSTASSALITFQGAASLSGPEFDTGFVRLLVDGVVQTPGVIPLIGAGGKGTHGFTWQTRPLAPGAHQARVQWRTDLGSSFCVDARSLTILYR
jgi:hypothetical protein